MTEAPGGKCALDYRARGPALYREVRCPPDYLDIGKKLFSLLRYRLKPVPTTMAGRSGLARRDVARAYRTRAFLRADVAGLACRRILPTARATRIEQRVHRPETLKP
ncbi:hypothetical protein [Burkholderia sp. Bp9143]|uniref:hypothetical protein n=1 Tax=Burkholderia sp. Bp9143 TaxID=2184574 RepID=UPI000F5A8DD4|nr:hypothetical protein [Burkholderia sp. Bp9143]